MKNLFDMENPLFRTLGKLADLMILNLTFIVCCLPVFTIGAALTGLHYVTLKMAENEEGYIFKGFWKSFKQNFKQATLLWLILLFFGIVLVLDFLILGSSEGSFVTVVRIILAVVVFLYAMVFLYVFPTLARFYNTLTNTLRNSFLMAVADFPRTLLMLVISVGSVLITLYNGYTLAYGVLIWILTGFSLIAYINGFFLKKIFAKYSPQEEETNPDNWSIDEEENPEISSALTPQITEDEEN